MNFNTRKTQWIIFILSILIIIAAAILINRRKNGPASGIKDHFAELIQSGVLYPVVRVIDGDTIIAGISGHDITIRLIGIDTPEVVDPRKPLQCFGKEASDRTKQTLTSTSVYIEKDPTKGNYDKYGRVLAYIFLSDAAKTLFNLTMIKEGFAREYTYFQEPYRYQSDFKAAPAEAKKKGIGLWDKKKCSTQK